MNGSERIERKRLLRSFPSISSCPFPLLWGLVSAVSDALVRYLVGLVRRGRGAARRTDETVRRRRETKKVLGHAAEHLFFESLNRLDVEVGHELRIVADKVVPWTNLIPHQALEPVIGLHGILNVHPKQCTSLRIHCCVE